MNTNIAALSRRHFDALRVRRIVERVFRSYTGALGVRLWDGHAILLGHDSPVATVVIHAATLLRALAWRPDVLRLAEAYFYEEIDVEGDLYALLKQKIHLQSVTMSMRDRLLLFSVAFFAGSDSARERVCSVDNTITGKHLAQAFESAQPGSHRLSL